MSIKEYDAVRSLMTLGASERELSRIIAAPRVVPSNERDGTDLERSEAMERLKRSEHARSERVERFERLESVDSWMV